MSNIKFGQQAFIKEIRVFKLPQRIREMLTLPPTAIGTQVGAALQRSL